MAQNLITTELTSYSLPITLPVEVAIRIELQEGVPVMRAPDTTQRRIETLLAKQQESELTDQEKSEIERFEEIDDYLSLINRLIRNQIHNKSLQAN